MKKNILFVFMFVMFGCNSLRVGTDYKEPGDVPQSSALTVLIEEINNPTKREEESIRFEIEEGRNGRYLSERQRAQFLLVLLKAQYDINAMKYKYEGGPERGVLSFGIDREFIHSIAVKQEAGKWTVEKVDK